MKSKALTLFVLMSVFYVLSVWAAWSWYGWKLAVVIMGFLTAHNFDRACKGELNKLQRKTQAETGRLEKFAMDATMKISSVYVYRLTTPFGCSYHIDVVPKGDDVVRWPDSLKERCRWWWLFNPEVVVDRTTQMEFESWQLGIPISKRSYVCPFDPWKQVFRWPVRKIWS